MAGWSRPGILVLVGAVVSPPVSAQEIFIHPSRGQNQAQQDRGRFATAGA
jgi:hypothetical protein